MNKSLDDADYDKDVDWFLARMHHLRYRINGSPEELVIAAEFALGSAIVSNSEDSAELLKECLEDPMMPRDRKRRILATAKTTKVL